MDFRSVDFVLFRTLVQTDPWETVFDNKGVQKGWTLWRNSYRHMNGLSPCTKRNATGQEDWTGWTGSFHTNSEIKKRVFDLVLVLARIGLTFAAAGRGKARTPGLFYTPSSHVQGDQVFLLVCQYVQLSGTSFHQMNCLNCELFACLFDFTLWF